MRLSISIALVLFCAVLSPAGQNPEIRIFLDVDPPNRVDEVYPASGTTFDVYVCLDCFGGGTRGTAFILVRTFAGFKLDQEALLGGLDFGDAEVDGWTIAAGEDCAYPPCPVDGIVLLGRLKYLYLGVPGVLSIQPHPGTGRQALDCLFNDEDQYCIHGNLGVGRPPEPGEYCEMCWIWGPRSVKCEPQGGGNPEHPPNYWFGVSTGGPYQPIHGFHLQVFDPDIANYSEWADPPGWTHSASVQQIGEELWLSWCDPEGDDPLDGWPRFRFKFANANPSASGQWTLTGPSAPCDPFADVVASSSNYAGCEDGYGYRVHVPVAGTPADARSWGVIKGLYR